MKKNKSITLLSIIGVIMAVLFFFTFARFEIGIKNYNSVLGAIDTEYDISGGTAFTLTLAKDNLKEVDDVSDVTKKLSSRLEALGYDYYKITTIESTEEGVKDSDIKIEIRAPLNDYGELDKTTLKNDIAVVIAFGELQFFAGVEANPSEEVLTDVDVIDEAYYAGSFANGDTIYYQVAIKFTEEAYASIQEGMAAGNYYFKIQLGENTLLAGSEALSSEYFSDRTIQISTASESQARQVALQINSGALEYKYEISEELDVPSPYGANVKNISMIVIGAIILLSIVLAIIKYKGFAIISGLSTLLFIVLELWMLILVPGIRLSLGGIIGIALSTILTIVGFFITFEKVGKEYAKGKTLKFSITTAYRNALKPLLISGIACGAFAFVLFLFTKGLIKGFAITFGIGAGLALIATLLFSRMFTSLLLPLTKNNSEFYNLKKSDVSEDTAE